MRKFLTAMFVVFGGMLPLAPAHADIIVSFLPAASNLIQQGSTPQNVSVFARATNNEVVSSLVVDFRLPAGGIVPTTPGAFKQPGMIGAGTGGTSSFDRGLSPFITSSANLDFGDAGLLFPSTDSLLVTMSIDPTGLNPGVYPITFDSVDPQGLLAAFVGVGQAGSFTVVAVPEPASLALVVGASFIGIFVRRRRLV